ncbi:MAG: hypothetical protein WC279_09380 [Sulfurimonas sp.]|jgi:hypothetical protein|uniref:hypothetical protein n=1 Tax=Sulfurimonas sp. TaxID=2022749 RepID=UPI003564232A
MINLLEQSEQLVEEETVQTLFLNSMHYIYKAYLEMIKTFPIKYKKEDDINDLLYAALLKVLQGDDGNSMLRPIAQSYNPLKRNTHGKASQVDLSIIWSLDAKHDSKQFYFECKRLSCNDKNKAYVNNGIKRYEDNFYAESMPYAAMIGYIENGDIDSIIKDINKKMTIHCISNITKNTKAYYQSVHMRNKNNDIDLYHIFFDFRDCQNRAKLCKGHKNNTSTFF